MEHVIDPEATYFTERLELILLLVDCEINLVGDINNYSRVK